MTKLPEENINSNRIIQNASYLMVSQVITWGLSLASAVILPRNFGPTATGQFHIAISLWVLVGIIVDFGIDAIITREIARNPTRLDEIVGSAMLLRLFFHIIGFGVLVVYTIALDYSSTVLVIVAILGISRWFSTIARTCGSALYGLEKMRAISVITVIVRIISDVLAITLTLLDFRLEIVIASTVTGSIVHLVLMWTSLYRRSGFVPRPNRQTMVWLLRSGAPLLITRLTRSLYTQLDVVIISLIVSELVVGWYGVADGLFGTMLFIPGVLGTAIFPTIARIYDKKPTEAANITRRIFHLILIPTIPIGFGIAAIATPLVLLIYGDDFIGAGPVLAIFGIVVIFTSLNTILSQQLIAMDKEVIVTRMTLIAVAIAIPLDLALIYYTHINYDNGAIGGALAYIITEAVITVGNIWILPSNTLNRSTVWLATKAFAAGMIMFTISWYTRDLFLAIPIALGAIVYLILVFVFKLVSSEDKELVRSVIMARTGRLARFSKNRR